MSLPDDEQRVLDAIEYQLLSEDPQLRDCFSALGSFVPPIKPVNGWWRTASDKQQTRRGPRQYTENEIFAIVIELGLVIIGVVLVVLLILGVLWMFAVFNH